MAHEHQNPAPQDADLRAATSTLREAIAELTRAIGHGAAGLGAEIRAEVVSELGAAAAEVACEFGAAAAEVRGASVRMTARQARAAKTREDLLHATAKLVGERGFEAASVADIAKEAGYTKGAFYAHFPSKEELFAALIDESSTNEATGFEDETSALDSTTIEAVDIQSVMLSLEAYLFALRRPQYRDRFAAIALRQLQFLARVSRYQRTGEAGEPEQRDIDAAMAMASFYTMGSVMQNVLGDEYDIKGATERLMERLAA